MARFRYKAVAPTGEVVEGEMEALARGAAIERLRELRHLPVRVEELAPGERGSFRAPPVERIEPVLEAPPAPPPRVAPVQPAPAPASPPPAPPLAEPSAKVTPLRPERPPIERITIDQAVEALQAEFADAPARSADERRSVEPAAANTDEPLVLDQEVAAEPAPAEAPPAEPAAEPAPAAVGPEAPPESTEDTEASLVYPEDREVRPSRWWRNRRSVDDRPQEEPQVEPQPESSAEPPVGPPAEPPAQPIAEARWMEWQEAAAAVAAAESVRREPPLQATPEAASATEEPAPPAAEPASAEQAADPTLMIAPEPIEPRPEPLAERAPQPAAHAPRKAKRGKAALPSHLQPVFTRELQVLLAAGLPMDRALRIIVESTADDRVATAADALLARVRGGALLSEAMDATPDRFDEFLRTAVRAGEAGGSLAEVLDQVASYQERGQRLLRSVRTALIYPSILAFAAAFSVILLLTLVVPQFEVLFRQSAQVPPLATRAVIAISAFVRSWGWIAPAAALVGWLVLRWRYSGARRRVVLHRRALRLPFVGRVIAGVSVERLARSLATLLANGVGLPEALGLVASTVPNRAVGAVVAAAVDRVKQGERLADALDEGNVLPPLAVQLVRVGEEGGRLVDMLARLADIYAGEVDVAVRRLTAVIEPVLILVIGTVVGGIVLSLLAAIAGLNALAL